MNTRKIGSAYESLACEKLENEGMQILETNYRVRIGEIDIIARDKDTLVFIEVKYRKNTDFGGAGYAIPAKKQATIRRVAEWYMVSHKFNSKTFCRFDAVLFDGTEINHIKNAW